MEKFSDRKAKAKEPAAIKVKTDLTKSAFLFSPLALGVVGWCDGAGQTSSAGASY